MTGVDYFMGQSLSKSKLVGPLSLDRTESDTLTLGIKFVSQISGTPSNPTTHIHNLHFIITTTGHSCKSEGFLNHSNLGSCVI
uniref:Uncharacterized protein n=1 Tax=Cannabis sativa TaxID=3483 RepID=A0A803R228_CANSA